MAAWLHHPQYPSASPAVTGRVEGERHGAALREQRGGRRQQHHNAAEEGGQQARACKEESLSAALRATPAGGCAQAPPSALTVAGLVLRLAGTGRQRVARPAATSPAPGHL